MNSVFIFLLVVVTSWIAYNATNRPPGDAPNLSKALGAFFEYVGMFVLFFVANLGLGLLIVILLRTFSERFFSLYVLGNIFLLILSAVQAFVFQFRWKRG